MKVVVLQTPLVVLLTAGDGSGQCPLADRWNGLSFDEQQQACDAALEQGYIDDGDDDERYLFTSRGDAVRRHLEDLAG